MAKRILIVDDNDDILFLIRLACEQAGFNARTAHNQAEMALLLTEELPDLIVLDVLLPGANGYQLIEELHHDPRTRAIPIMVMTGRAESLYRRMSTDLGVVCHLTKPFPPEVVVAQAGVIFGEHLTGPEADSGAAYAR